MPILNLYREAYRDIPRTVWILAAVQLINRSGAMVLTFLALYLVDHLGLSLKQTGWVFSVYGVGAMLGGILGGWLTDRWGSRHIQAFSLLAAGLGFLALSQMTLYVGLLAAVLWIAVLGEMFRPANGAAISLWAPPGGMSQAYALNRMAVNLGGSIGPSLGGLLVGFGFTWLFIADGVTCLLAALGVWFLLPRQEIREEDLRPPQGKWQQGPPWRDGPFLALMLLIFMWSMGFFQIFSTFPLYIRDHFGMSSAGYGVLMGFSGVLILLFEMILIAKIKKHHPLRWIAWGAFLSGLGFALMPWFSHWIHAFFCVTIFTFGEMLVIPLSAALVGKRSHGRFKGQYMGMYTFAFSLAYVMAPLAGTRVFATMSPTTLWMGTGILGLLTMMGFLAMKRSFESWTG
jgi:predicted MFS family arabinose efflux permease